MAWSTEVHQESSTISFNPKFPFMRQLKVGSETGYIHHSIRSAKCGIGKIFLHIEKICMMKRLFRDLNIEELQDPSDVPCDLRYTFLPPPYSRTFIVLSVARSPSSVYLESRSFSLRIARISARRICATNWMKYRP